MRARYLVFVVAVFLLPPIASASAFACWNRTNPDGSTSKSCHHFHGKSCDDKQVLALLGEYIPQGWTCHDYSNQSIQVDIGLVTQPGGNTSVFMDGQEFQIASDETAGFLDKKLQQGPTSRASQEAKRAEFDAVLAADDGRVSDARLRQLSSDLGVEIQYAGGKRPPAGVATGSNSPAAGKAPVAGQGAKVPAEECSLPDCSCRIVNLARESLCEGGIEGETAGGVHFCQCGEWGASSIQQGGGGGTFAVDGESGPPAARSRGKR